MNYQVKTRKETKKRREENRKKIDYMFKQKRARNVRVVLQRLLAKLNESWFKVSTARHLVNEGAQFSENALYNHLWNMIYN